MVERPVDLAEAEEWARWAAVHDGWDKTRALMGVLLAEYERRGEGLASLRDRLRRALGCDELPDDDGLVLDIQEVIRLARWRGGGVPAGYQEPEFTRADVARVADEWDRTADRILAYGEDDDLREQARAGVYRACAQTMRHLVHMDAAASAPASGVDEAARLDRAARAARLAKLSISPDRDAWPKLSEYDRERWRRVVRAVAAELGVPLADPTTPSPDLASVARDAYYRAGGSEESPVEGVTAGQVWAAVVDAVRAADKQLGRPAESGEGPDEVWLPPPDDCMDHAHDPCPHCSSRIFHHRTGRCGSCGRRPTTASPVDA